ADVNPAPSIQRCEDCNAELSELTVAADCPRCGGLLQIVHDYNSLNPTLLRAGFADRRVASARDDRDVSGVWRYRELVLPSAARHEVVTHPEGNTPLLARERVAAFAGVDELFLKHEGHNPTGSFKDRGMTVAMTQARRTGATAVACASTGNTSASRAADASPAG